MASAAFEAAGIICKKSQRRIQGHEKCGQLCTSRGRLLDMTCAKNHVIMKQRGKLKHTGGRVLRKRPQFILANHL